MVLVPEGAFPDGNQYLKVPWPQCDGQNLLYICSYFHNDERKLVDLRVMQVLSERGALHLSVIVPFFGQGTNERAETGISADGLPYESIAIAALDAKAFGAIGNANTRSRLLIFDLHTLANRFYFPPSVSVVMCSTVPYVLNKLADLIEVVVAPDGNII